jgi:hypothetical protein
VRLTAARNSNKPAPGLPSGNVENNLCSVYLPADPRQLTIRKRASLLEPHIAASFHTSFWVWVLRRPSFLQLDNSAAEANRDRLSTIIRAKFLHDVLDVNLYSLFGDEELLRDVSIPVPLGNLI